MTNNKPIPKATECEWPIHEDKSGVTFCCAKPKLGSSYCAEHHSIAYYTPEDNSDLEIEEDNMTLVDDSIDMEPLAE